MQAGRTIDFLNKEAEEVQNKEVSTTPNAEAAIDAPLKEEPPTENTVDTHVTFPELPEPTAAEASGTKASDVTSTAIGEKTAADASARDKAMEFAAKAGRPTSTGIVAGAGLGSIMAALGALHRTNTPDSSHSVLSNPVLLGLLGAAGGYFGGNLFERHPSAVEPPRKAKAPVIVPGAIAALGTLGLGKSLASRDDAISENALISRYERLVNRGTVSRLVNGRTIRKFDFRSLTRAEQKEYDQIRNELASILQRNKEYSRLESFGLKDHPKLSRFERIMKSTLNPVRQIGALNPFKHIEGTFGNLLRRELASIFSPRNLLRRRGMPARLAAIAALAGAGTAGVNALRNANSEDKA